MKRPQTGNKVIDFLIRTYHASDAIINADKIILNNIDRLALNNRVNLNYWDSSIEISPNVSHNLGDNLSTVIVSEMLKKRGLSLSDTIKGRKHLYAIGSILSMGFQNATIWGSGFLVDLKWPRTIIHSHQLRKLDIRAVRGPLSRKVLLKLGHKCPERYGDPALLLPLFYHPQVKKSKDFVIIPHFSKNGEYMKNEKYKDKIVSMITNDYESFVDRICSADRVISGSLHGIIIAESYGIPSLFLRDREAVKDFKYMDYYLSTNRSSFSYASSIDDALRKLPMSLPTNLDVLQQDLLDSFPYDLWQ